MAMQVGGKTAIVTGAGSGINFEFAKLLLSKGCNVVAADLTLRPESQELISQYSSSEKARAVFHKTDVREWKQLESMFEVASEEFGGADIVCPGAGVYEPVSRHVVMSCRFANLVDSSSQISGLSLESSLRPMLFRNLDTPQWTLILHIQSESLNSPSPTSSSTRSQGLFYMLAVSLDKSHSSPRHST